MEESLSLAEQIRGEFGLEEKDLQTYSPLTFAFVGDSIYELIVRTVTAQRHNAPPGRLHREKCVYVNAGAQARMARALADVLTPEEETIYRRGRNAKPASMAKNATGTQYRMATGLETLFGYLYLHGRLERLLFLTRLAMERLDGQEI